MENFQLQTYLATAPLWEEAKHNLNTIFHTLSDSRKLEILNNWPKYLDLLLRIEKKGVEERQNNIQEAMWKIDDIISDALHREKERLIQENTEKLKQHEYRIGAAKYDIQIQNQELQKKLQILRQSEKPPIHNTPPLFDPLWNLLLLIISSALLHSIQIMFTISIG